MAGAVLPRLNFAASTYITLSDWFLDQMRMHLFLWSQRFDGTQAYSKQSHQGRPEALNLGISI
jgi:hypothetical protein